MSNTVVDKKDNKEKSLDIDKEKEMLESWNNFLKDKYNIPNTFKLVNTLKYKENNMWRLTAVILCAVFLLEIASGIIYFGFVIEDGKLKELFSVSTNTTNINNIDVPDIPITNEYKHEIFNNITVNVQIPNNITMRLQNGTG